MAQFNKSLYCKIAVIESWNQNKIDWLTWTEQDVSRLIKQWKVKLLLNVLQFKNFTEKQCGFGGGEDTGCWLDVTNNLILSLM